MENGSDARKPIWKKTLFSKLMKIRKNEIKRILWCYKLSQVLWRTCLVQVTGTFAFYMNAHMSVSSPSDWKLLWQDGWSSGSPGSNLMWNTLDSFEIISSFLHFILQLLYVFIKDVSTKYCTLLLKCSRRDTDMSISMTSGIFSVNRQLYEHKVTLRWALVLVCPC